MDDKRIITASETIAAFKLIFQLGLLDAVCSARCRETRNGGQIQRFWKKEGHDPLRKTTAGVIPLLSL
jgi:hypothetical protein